MRDEFLVFKEYYRQAANKVAVDSFYRQTMNHKFKHSIEVLHIGQTILQQTPELAHQTEEFKRLAEIALLFHDVGRFEEAARQDAAQRKNITVAAASNVYDHGLIGYELLKQNPRYNDMRILFALKWHGKMMEAITSSADWQEVMLLPEFEEIKQILFLVRDADKLANLHHIKVENHLTKDLFYRQLTLDALHAPISEKVLQQFLAHHTILFPTVYSFADRVLMVLSWIFDLNYQVSKKIFREQKYASYLLDLLAQNHINSEVIVQIKQLIKKG